MRTRSWVLGYHGCDRKVGERVLAGDDVLRPSRNDWDWLGTGIYFWENNPGRALDWAKYIKSHQSLFKTAVNEPFALGAVIDLGDCLDLLEAESIRVVKEAHEELKQHLRELGAPTPVNRGAGPDWVIRTLDCAVINYVHDLRKQQEEGPFDSVRAAFVEGESLYENAGFKRRTHIQLCVRRESQIVGYFRWPKR